MKKAKSWKDWLPKPSYILTRFHLHVLVLSFTPILVIVYLLTKLDFSGQQVMVGRIQLTALAACAIVAAILSMVRMHGFLASMVRLIRRVKSTDLEAVDDKVVSDWLTDPGEVGELARFLGELLTALKDRNRQLTTAKETLQNPLSSVGKAVTFCTNFETLSSLILETLVDGVNAKGGALFSYGEGTEGEFRLMATVARGRLSDDQIRASLDSYLKWMHQERRLLVLPAVDQVQVNQLFTPPLIFAPFISQGRLLGAICISGHRAGRNFSEEEVRLVSKISVLLAVAFQHFQGAGKNDRTFLETLCALAFAVELRTPHLRGHVERVANYAIDIARKMGVDEQTSRVVWDSARLHDIGKLGMDPSIIVKSSSRESGEWQLVAQHPRIGEQMLRPLANMGEVLNVVRHHHEFLDGSGFPDGLKDGAISLPTRIVTVANIYDGLTTDRPDRNGLRSQEAIKIVKQMAREGKLDLDVVESLQSILQESSHKMSTPSRLVASR